MTAVYQDVHVKTAGKVMDVSMLTAQESQTVTLTIVKTVHVMILCHNQYAGKVTQHQLFELVQIHTGSQPLGHVICQAEQILGTLVQNSFILF